MQCDVVIMYLHHAVKKKKKTYDEESDGPNNELNVLSIKLHCAIMYVCLILLCTQLTIWHLAKSFAVQVIETNWRRLSLSHTFLF